MHKVIFILALLAGLSGCTTRYVDRSQDTNKHETTSALTPEVLYHLYTEHWQPSPECIAMPPLKAKDADRDKLELVRRGMYAHLAPKGYRLAELSRVDLWIATQQGTVALSKLGKDLQCEHILEGEITQFDSGFFGIFSKVSVGARLRLIRTSDNAILWEGEHIATLHDGGLPLSPVGTVSSLFNAGRNLGDEQTYRIIDDLARRLMNTLPDATPTHQIKPHINLHEWLASMPETERESALLDLFQRNALSLQEQETAYRLLTQNSNKARHWRSWAAYRLQRDDLHGALEHLHKAAKLAPEEPETWALQSRVLIRMNRLDEADASVLKAISHNASNPDYYETLAWISSRRALPERARAALDKAINLDPGRPWPWHNRAIGEFNAGHWQSALDDFSTAAKLYQAQGKSAQVERILSDMSDLKLHLGEQAILDRKANLSTAQPTTSPTGEKTP